MESIIQFKTLEEQGGKCPECEYGKLYKDLSDSNKKFPITADAARHYDKLLRERGICLDTYGHMNLIFTMMNLGCRECLLSQGVDVI